MILPIDHPVWSGDCSDIEPEWKSKNLPAGYKFLSKTQLEQTYNDSRSKKLYFFQLSQPKAQT